MAHRRPPLVRALGLNTVVLVAELGAGLGGNSLSLIMDGVHNVSDEAALILLVLAYSLPAGLSGRALGFANLFNSIGLLGISGLLVWRAVERLSQPPPILGVIPLVAGLVGAAGNWGVARALREPSRADAAIRLAYVHNLGDTVVSLVPALAGALTLVTGSALFDPLLALLIAAAIVVPSLRTVIAFRRELAWPSNVACGPHHPASPHA